MKKTYTKPEIAFESFASCTSIAAGCEVQPNTQSNFHSCGLDVSGEQVFGVGLDFGGCKDTQIGENDDYNSICYHTPSEDKNIFNS